MKITSPPLSPNLTPRSSRTGTLGGNAGRGRMPGNSGRRKGLWLGTLAGYAGRGRWPGTQARDTGRGMLVAGKGPWLGTLPGDGPGEYQSLDRESDQGRWRAMARGELARREMA